MASRYRVRKYRRQRRLKKAEAGRFRVWGVQAGKGALGLATLASLVFLGFMLYRYFQLSGQLNVGEVKILGCGNALESELLDLAQIDLRANFLKLDLQELSRRLAQHPWVEKSQVRRDFSGRALIIEVQERVPRALVLLDGLYLVDRNGEIFKKADPKEKLDFPVLTGLNPKEWKQGDPAARELIHQALEFLDLLGGRKLFNLKEISEIHLNKEDGLTLFTLKGGVPIRLGLGEYGDKLNRLEKVLPDLRPKWNSVEYLDLHVPKRVVVKMRDSGPEKSH